jgi:glycosyltransferase involved in cell wall biosynthesis
VRVLHVAPNVSRAYGGPTYSLTAYSIAAMSAGASVTIAAPKSPDADRAWMAAWLPNVKVFSFPSYGSGAFLAAPALHGWMRRHGSDFDVVHVHGLLNPISSLASRRCIRNGWPLVIRPFGTLSRFTFAHRRALLKTVYMTLIEQRNLRYASAIHFTTNAERDASSWHCIDWGDRARVVPPPWIGASASPSVSRFESTTVLFLSRLHPVKNVELLLAAWPVVLQRIPSARLVIAGDGDAAYVRDLHELARGLERSVTFAGHVEGAAKKELLSAAAALALPSFHENFGIAVLEALASGLPVVITPEVQLSEFVSEHSLGLVSERSAPAFADAIVQSLTDHALRERCIAEGPQLVTRYFSPSAVGDALLQMYRFAASHSKAGMAHT